MPAVAEALKELGHSTLHRREGDTGKDSRELPPRYQTVAARPPPSVQSWSPRRPGEFWATGAADAQGACAGCGGQMCRCLGAPSPCCVPLCVSLVLCEGPIALQGSGETAA